ncbi:hypothetical protein ACWT_4668 [Actinoplanes sp. SE50]|uniref:hypothetical protein n=1 Tax=unclassified Actinoplanes TaxID=2626549 RepID=UPI00023EBBD5|nr:MULTISPECIES: hypothetical protein [unclassified Actinoplanes]AEV85690.1 hypothetical protein ACPL_4799 [Actinoplanes sp. SE50/110]ATO84083.1 hypothetical protein ACWT_4668 [Actinoplanes sp. SE50]SLM01493.1 hypothetical protein ACSP50_4729 [Actinoplanes sp. SE50/110]
MGKLDPEAFRYPVGMPHSRCMLKLAAARRIVAAMLILLGACASLLAVAGPAAAAVSSSTDKLVLTWAEGGNQLRVTGFGYRARDLVEVRLGSSPIQQTRGDENGRIEVDVPQSLVGTGASGTSIVLAGRSASGAARVLVSAVPPQATGRGPVEVLPWALGALAAVTLGLGARLRRRSGHPVAAPGGYRGRRRLAV